MKGLLGSGIIGSCQVLSDGGYLDLSSQEDAFLVKHQLEFRHSSSSHGRNKEWLGDVLVL